MIYIYYTKKYNIYIYYVRYGDSNMMMRIVIICFSFTYRFLVFSHDFVPWILCLTKVLKLIRVRLLKSILLLDFYTGLKRFENKYMPGKVEISKNKYNLVWN